MGFISEYQREFMSVVLHHSPGWWFRLPNALRFFFCFPHHYIHERRKAAGTALNENRHLTMESLLSLSSYCVFQVSQQVAVMSKNSPLWDATGMMPTADRPDTTICSYSSIHDALSKKSVSFTTKYKQFIKKT